MEHTFKDYLESELDRWEKFSKSGKLKSAKKLKSISKRSGIAPGFLCGLVKFNLKNISNVRWNQERQLVIIQESPGVSTGVTARFAQRVAVEEYFKAWARAIQAELKSNKPISAEVLQDLYDRLPEVSSSDDNANG